MSALYILNVVSRDINQVSLYIHFARRGERGCELKEGKNVREIIGSSRENCAT